VSNLPKAVINFFKPTHSARTQNPPLIHPFLKATLQPFCPVLIVEPTNVYAAIENQCTQKNMVQSMTRVEIKIPLQNVIPKELKALAIYNLIIHTTTFRYIHGIIELIY
jgi:hypothetical protein